MRVAGSIRVTPWRWALLGFILTTVLSAGQPATADAPADEPAARAVLFFSPTCPHCHIVINEALPDIFADYGGDPEVVWDRALSEEERAFYIVRNDMVEILLADISIEAGAALFEAATTAYGISSLGVPRLVVGAEVMVGSAEIPARLPAIVAAAVDSGKEIGWPAIPGVEEAVAATLDTPAEPPTATSTPPSTAPDAKPGIVPAAPSRSPWDRFRQDAVGNSIALAVLLAMLAAIVGAAVRLGRRGGDGRPSRVIPMLAAIGLLIAAYLTVMEVGGSEATCGPIGDCNAVQQSNHAHLFGIVPIALIGVIGYVAVILTWTLARYAARPWATRASVAMFFGAAVGTALSAYLTYLEPFVIGATCMWCVTSAALITAVLWLSVAPARSALAFWERRHPNRPAAT